MKKKKKNNKYKITVRKFFGHLHVVNKHRFKVFCLCCRAGVVWRGLTHDLSKYSCTEFFESVRYFVGDRSPIMVCKKVNGYSKAWLHHKGRNKHHHEYWYDYAAPDKTPIIPYSYFVEMVCDMLAAGMTYQGKKWTNEYELNYWMNKREECKINPKLDFLLTKIFTDISSEGVKKVINKKNLKELYRKYIG
ncbi:MAG: DUF5662 family protein [Tenericutes bacterium]|nr:DUF5662 family protein [Mycoplasmatota bacterium]MDD6941971.1 DUF5662 family protein [bacterium]MDY2697542.1 DUF5662 family protein [Bacilli bacterium]